MSEKSPEYDYTYKTQTFPNDQTPTAAGIPGSKSFVSWKDVAALIVVLSCTVGSTIAVYFQPVAVSLGQTNQLIIVGFCLTVMAMCTHRQIRLASIMYGVQIGQSSIQDFDALLRSDLLAKHAGLKNQLVIFLLTTLPLALGVSYKRFVGGTSSVTVAASDGTFGLALPPGYERIGIGLAVTSNQYLPFWVDPDINRTYGFALYVESNTTAGLLDAPFSEYFETLQRQMGGEETILISARVNATVSESIPLPAYERSEKGWNETQAYFDGGQWIINDMVYGHFVLFASRTAKNNNSRAIVSIWDEANQTAQSQARQIYTNRREAYGTWKITSSNITLHSAEILPQTSLTLDPKRQNIIEDNTNGISETWIREFDWVRYPRAKDFDTTPAMIATAFGCAITSLNRHKRDWEKSPWDDGVNGRDPYVYYNKTGSEIHVVRERVSLRRDPWLLFILQINPALTILGIVVKIWLHHCPIDDNVGLISLLAGVHPETLGVLKGAALSGKLSRRVHMQFQIVQDRIEVRLDETDKAHHIERGRNYS